MNGQAGTVSPSVRKFCRAQIYFCHRSGNGERHGNKGLRSAEGGRAAAVQRLSTESPGRVLRRSCRGMAEMQRGAALRKAVAAAAVILGAIAVVALVATPDGRGFDQAYPGSIVLTSKTMLQEDRWFAETEHELLSTELTSTPAQHCGDGQRRAQGHPQRSVSSYVTLLFLCTGSAAC